MCECSCCGAQSVDLLSRLLSDVLLSVIGFRVVRVSVSAARTIVSSA